MDVTNNAGGQISAALAALPAEVQPVLQAAFDRLDALEAKSAADAKADIEQITTALQSSVTALLAELQAWRALLTNGFSIGPKVSYNGTTGTTK